MAPAMRDRVRRAWREEPPEDFVPGCFPSKRAFVAWLEFFSKMTDPRDVETFCSDCTPEYHRKMKQLHKCAFVDVTWAIDATTGLPEGVRHVEK